MHTCLLPNLELGSRITTTAFKYGISFGFGFGNNPSNFFDLGSNLELENNLITDHWNSRTHYQ